MSSKGRKTTLAIIVAVIIIVAAGIGTYYSLFLAPAPTPTISIKVGVIAGGSIEDAPAYVGISKGIFFKYGLNVSTIPVTGGMPGLESLIQFSVSGVQAVFTDFYRGAPRKILGVSILGPDFVVVAKPDSTIKTPADLRGKKIGITRFGSVTHAMGVLMAAEGNLKVDEDFKLVPLGGLQAQLASLTSGQIDGFIWTVEAGYQLEEKNQGKVVMVLSQFIKGPWVQTGVTTWVDYLPTHKDISRNFVKAYYESVRYMQSNLEESAKILTKFSEISESAWLKALKATKFSSNGEFTEEVMRGLTTYGELLLRLKLIDKIPPMNEIVVTDYVPS